MARIPEIEYAIKILKKNYERARKLEYVRDPISWALYYTWLQFDARRERPTKHE